VDAKLRFQLHFTDASLDLVPSVVLQFSVFNFERRTEKRSRVEIMNEVKEDGDGAKDPEQSANENEDIGPKREA